MVPGFHEGSGRHERLHSADRDSRDGSDKIITAGRSRWELAQTNLVEELRTLLRARDMALAEQRARHVKESVIIREQRHVLSRKEPGFTGKLAKLLGWADAGSSPTSMSPLDVSPVRSRSVSPIGSPTTTRRKEGDDLVEDYAVTRTHVKNGEADVAVGRTELSKRLEALDTPTVEILGDGAGKDTKKEPDMRSSPSSGIVDSSMLLVTGPANKEESTSAACPRCARLHQELETALTDRTLAEAELVSMRRAISQVDTGWEWESSNVAEIRRGTNPDIEDDMGGGTAPVAASGGVDSNLGLRHELGRLEEALESLRAPKIDQNIMNGQGLPTLQESVLQPQDEANGNKSASLAASLSATVAGRARYFEELMRRRVLRLGIEADLRKARAKLDILSASLPPISQGSDPAKDEVELTAGKSEGGATGEIRHRQGDKSDGANEEKSAGVGQGKGNGSRTPKHQQDACRTPATNVALSKKQEGLGERAKDGRTSSQEPKRRVGRSRGNDVIVADAPATPSANKRHRRAPGEKATAHEDPKETISKGHRSATVDTETATGPALSTSKKTTGSARRQRPVALQEKHSKQRESTSNTANETDTATQDKAFDDPTNASLVKGELQEQDGAVTRGRVERLRDEKCHTATECAAEAITMESPPCGAIETSDHRDCKTGGKAVTKPAKATKPKSPPSVRPELAPRSSQRKPKGVSSPAAQLRKPSIPPRGGLSNDGAATDQLKTKLDSSIVGDSRTKDIGDVGAGDTIGSRPPYAANNVTGKDGVILELVADTTEPPGQENVDDVADAEGRDNMTTQKKAERRTRVAPKLLRRQAAIDPVPLKSPSRPLGKTTRLQPALRVAKTPPTRLGITTKSKRALVPNRDKGAAGLTLEKVSRDHAAAAEVAEDAQKPETFETEHPLGWSLVGSTARDSIEVDGAVQGEGAEEGGTVRGNIADKDNGFVLASTESTQNEAVCLEMHHSPSAMPTQDAEAVGGDCNGSLGRKETGQRPTDCCDGRVGVVPQPSDEGENGSADIALPRDAVDLAEALRGEVDRLRLERAELEDTVAQLNVAAAQLYFVEYEQMKMKCRQLKRVILGPSSRPTEQESAYGHSCQEILYRLKVIGVNFFRRRVGGVMGQTFFPDGLARTLSLIGRRNVAQECQTTPIDGLGPLGHGGASLAWPVSRDVCVQVAGGIDAEDEPLMEQQVYSLLGKLDLVLKHREDVLRTYHREAEEGAREARALLASAAAQHDPGHAWGVARPPNIRQLIGGREGPAGAPRPAINPTNLLFTAAVVLDSVVATGPGLTPEPSDTPNSTASKGAGDHRSRRQRFSPAEKALMELAGEVVAALESEQRRSDASAERRRFLMERRNGGRCPGDNHREGEIGTKALGRPPMGVPPLIWAMEIHLVGKLAQAFRTAVEARGFEREVEDANLVAAVSLGRSPPFSTNAGGKNDLSHAGHLGHRMLSVLRAEEDEERARRQRGRGTSEKDDGEVIRGREQKSFDWGAGTYSPHGTPRLSKNGSGGNGVPSTNSSRPNSPRRTEGFASAELSGRQATTGRPSARGVYHGSTLHLKPTQQYTELAVAPRNHQNQPQRDLQGHDSAAVARVEAAVFDTVRPSRLHPRPGSASVEGRRGCATSERVAASAASTQRHRPRPQSARLAEPDDPFASDSRLPAGRRAYGEATTPASNMTTGWQHRRPPARPTTTCTASAASRRPASAGGRVVDTRIWCSIKNKEVGGGVFRCRPNSAIRAATVRFEGDGVSPSPLGPTHAGEVPEFLRRKERDLVEGNREKWAAVNGRFGVVFDDDHQRVSGPAEERVEYHREAGGSRDESNGDRQGVKTMESNGWGVERGSPGLSSVRLEDSMDGEGLLPDAGEQAFFDAWKPAGYDIDLSRYD